MVIKSFKLLISLYIYGCQRILKFINTSVGGLILFHCRHRITTQVSNQTNSKQSHRLLEAAGQLARSPDSQQFLLLSHSTF